MEPENPIVIGIPGKWSTRKEIGADIASKSQGLLLVGPVLMNTATKKGYKFEIYERDPHLAKAFEIAGRPRITEEDIQAIRSHTFTLYLIAEGSSPELAQSVLNIGCGLLQAGGIAVKVETTGKAHIAKDWFVLAAAQNETALYHAFVTLIGRQGMFYSCGMHNLGYRDAIIEDDITPDDAAHLLQTFLLYTLIEQPILKEGHTFSKTADSPYYRLRAVPCETYQRDHSFFNPFGMWQLEVIHNKRP